MLGYAWLASAIALGLHVADEATHDFLGWYNPQALRIRHALGGFPFPPTFSYRPWLIGLGGAVAGLLILTPFAFTGARWMLGVANVVAAIHLLNGSLHLSGALLTRRAVPGVMTAPGLIAAGLWLWLAAAHVR